jgi:hypothetical protein
MATIDPFQPYRYASRPTPLAELVTQPYDKISPEMQARYLARSPHNLVRIILGERYDSDNEWNMCTFGRGLPEGVDRFRRFGRDSSPAFYPYPAVRGSGLVRRW